MGGTNLSEAFGRPAAAGSALSGLLPPRPPAGTKQSPQELAPVTDRGAAGIGEPEVPAADTTPAPARPERSKSRPPGPGRELRRAPAEQKQAQTHQVLVYVSPAVKAAAERHRKQHQITNGEIVLDALDATHDELRELIAARYVSTRSEDSIFPARRVARRASSPSTRKVSFAFRATAVEVAIIQDLVRDFGAQSQSELVAAALERFLTGRGRR